MNQRTCVMVVLILRQSAKAFPPSGWSPLLETSTCVTSRKIAGSSQNKTCRHTKSFVQGVHKARTDSRDVEAASPALKAGTWLSHSKRLNFM